jgi:hypothetical protein
MQMPGWATWVATKLGSIHRENANDTLSWGRCASSAALVFAMSVVGYSVFHNHVWPSAWTDLGGFIIAPYTASKAGTTIQAFANKDNKI